MRHLEAGVALADDEDVAPLVSGRVARVDVVSRVLEPGNLGAPGLGHPEREDGRAAAVLAIARLEYEPLALVASGLPGAAVTGLEAGAVGEGAEAGLHLGAGGQVVRTIHQCGDERLQVGLLGEEAVVVVPLVLP